MRFLHKRPTIKRRFYGLLIIPVLLLVAIWIFRPAPQPEPVDFAQLSDRDQIIYLVMRRQHDNSNGFGELIKEYGSGSGVYLRLMDALADARYCVRLYTQGKGSEERLGKSGFLHNIFDPLTSSSRERIDPSLLPGHLRADTITSQCITGRIEISEPQINGTGATIRADLVCPGWCGSGEAMVFKKLDDRWRFAEVTHWWVS